MGLFACNGLAKGEVVWAERAQAGSQISATPRSHAWIENLPPASKRAYCHFMYKTGEDEYQSLAEFNDMPIEDFPSVRTVDVSNYMNHSCSPTCLFVDGGSAYTGLMVAARELLPGDEITFDYCTSEDCELSPEWQCLCGSPECRGRVTPHDWRLPELQRKYASHFLAHIAAKIAAATGSPEVPLLPVDPSGSWWLKQLLPQQLGHEQREHPAQQLSGVASASAEAEARAEGSEPVRKEPRLLPPPEAAPPPATSATSGESSHARSDARSDASSRHRTALWHGRATGKALDTLNRQAAMLIVHHRLKVCQNDEVGGFVRLGAPVRKGELVMLLPPNLLLWEGDVDDFNKCLQVGISASGERLFSSSITAHDIDNFLCHSCEPNCRFLVGSDFAAGLRACRDLEAGEAINFDYDETEDDLTFDRGGFECHCGVPSCRKYVLGRLYSPPPGGPPPGAPPPHGFVPC